ncbi:MAG: nucleotidyl transferase AbiEii/AbiGii toxin family protein [Verrucomicrobiales bacterium]|nr:nucleotidyl transferase AbiEii/AbiGii toxin family protein [Verrucomicrobiales bacterium]
MDGFEATQLVIETAEKLGLGYMLVGGLSSMAYGIPRATKDADLVMAVGPGDLDRLTAELGDEFTLDPQGTFEMVTGTMRYHLRIADTTFEIELFLLSTDPHDQSRFERRVPVRLDHLNGVTASIPTAEDVIVMKLRCYYIAQRGKDREDIRDVIAVQGDDAFDRDYIHSRTYEHGTRELLDEIRASIPPLD